MYGEITSPNYPQGYPSNVEETWEISVPEGFGIRIYFIHLDIEPSENCEYDYVQVLVDYTAGKKLCGRKSGLLLGSPLEEMYFPYNSLKMYFKSDFSNQIRHTGFAAYYVAVDIDECKETSEGECSHFCNNYIGSYFCSCPPEYTLHTDNRTCGVNCSGGLFMDVEGIISSPGFPDPYPENTRCEYKVLMEVGLSVVITFQVEEFDIEEDKDGSCFDALTIKAGERTFGPFCGKRPPNPPVIETGSNMADIIFQTDRGGQNKGWRIRYYGDAIPCPMQVTPHSELEPEQDKYVFKDLVAVICEEGYEAVIGEKSHRSFRSSCQGDGTWSNNHILCQVVDCGEPEAIENGAVIPSSSQTTYGSEIQYICLNEYYSLSLPGTKHGKYQATYRCSSDGFWINEKGGTDLPKCTPVCSVQKTKSAGRIYGGSPASHGQFPWMIKFVPSLGGGALISDQWILTAAHVVFGNSHPEMYGGGISPRVRLQAKQVIIHPYYRGTEDPSTQTDFNNDIALIQLSKKVQLGPCISPICLPRKGLFPAIDEIALVAGWGKTEKSDFERILKFTGVTHSDMEKCRKATGNSGVITANMFCAGSETGNDSCVGDSGGPIMFTDQVNDDKLYAAGIVSWGPVNCGTYALYTKVDNYLDWINQTIKTEEQEANDGAGEEPFIVCRKAAG
ncbi:hypothetical protein GDO86_013638 [Hymenochirus boettgeri]|uniref:Uncharacterized protein n=1 Tax=Hymenochirus boettgeri TaxID=247094 RepID=A0A8T2IS56_9PIPI|nr:hypothetical protein GDO86_013638 [Hymenochirus boettgeri]